MNPRFTSYLKRTVFSSLNKRLKGSLLKAINLLLLLFFIVISDSAKTQTLENTALKHEPVIYINLMLPSADTMLLVDGTGAMYAYKFSNNVDEYDAGKLPNFNENICLMRNGQELAIEARKIPVRTDTLFIHMWGMRHQTYDLQVVPQNVPLLLPAHGWMVDNYLHKKTLISLYNKTLYSFTPEKDTESYMNRFMLVFVRDLKQGDNELNINNNTAVNAGRVTVYPNPVTGNSAALQFINMAKDNYNIKLSNLSGAIFTSVNIIHNGNNNEYYLPLNSVYTQGVYTITITGKNAEKRIHLPIIINK